MLKIFPIASYSTNADLTPSTLLGHCLSMIVFKYWSRNMSDSAPGLEMKLKWSLLENTSCDPQGLCKTSQQLNISLFVSSLLQSTGFWTIRHRVGSRITRNPCSGKCMLFTFCWNRDVRFRDQYLLDLLAMMIHDEVCWKFEFSHYWSEPPCQSIIRHEPLAPLALFYWPYVWSRMRSLLRRRKLTCWDGEGMQQSRQILDGNYSSMSVSLI